MKIFKSLKSRIILFSLLIVSFSLLVTSFVISNKIEKDLSASLENNALNLLETIKVNIETEYRNIMKYNSSAIERRKAELKNHVDIIYGMMEAYVEQIDKGNITEQDAKKILLTTIKNINFDNNVGYFWINDTQKPFPKMIYHKTMPELNGLILDNPEFNCVIGTNKNLFSAMVDVCDSLGEGYVSYLWPKPTVNGMTVAQPKLSYVKLFKQWNWIIGTGVYMDDIETETNKRISNVVTSLNKTISKRMVAESGYCFIFGEDNFMYVHPYLANKSGDELINPSTSNKILDDIKIAYNSNQKFMEYLWNRIDDRDNFIYPKKAFITKFEPLQWYICVSIYKYDFEQKIRSLTKTIFLITLVFLFVALIISLLIARSITSPLNKLIGHLKKTDVSGLPKKLKSDGNTSEIITLSKTINNMIESVEDSRMELKNERDFSMGIINGSPDLICGLKNDGQIIFINKSGEKLTGYTQSELIEKKFWDLMVYESESDIERLKSTILGSLKSNFEIKIKNKNGENLILLWNSIAFFKHYKENVDILGNCLDITDRKMAEEKLKYFQKYLSRIINSMPSILIGINDDGIITQWNNEAKRLFKLKYTVGSSIYDLNLNLNLTKQLIEETITSETPKTILKENFQYENSNYYLEIVIYPLIYENYRGAVIRVDDITDKVKMEEMMVHSEKMLSIGGLAAGMAHEINNPIAGMLQNAIVLKNKLSMNFDVNIAIAKEIGLNLNFLNKYIEVRKIDKHLELIKQSGVRAAEIVLNMLSFAKKGDFKFDFANIPDLVDETLKILNSDYNINKKYDFQKIKIIKNYEKNIPKIKCEITKLQQVFLNILKNGAEAIYKNKDLISEPQFVINIFENNHNVVIEIENNGPQIPIEVRKRIFEPFFTTKKNGEGTGLGLSVSYFIITRHHNGIMRVESNENNRTRFIIELPIRMIA